MKFADADLPFRVTQEGWKTVKECSNIVFWFIIKNFNVHREQIRNLNYRI